MSLGKMRNNYTLLEENNLDVSIQRRVSGIKNDKLMSSIYASTALRSSFNFCSEHSELVVTSAIRQYDCFSFCFASDFSFFLYP